MGLAQDAQSAVTHYEQSARAATGAVQDLLTTVDRLCEQLSERGPLGRSSDPRLTQARELLTAARAQLATAVEGTTASALASRAYVDRAFPA